MVDGDTIDVRLKNGKQERVRFILVDTPETVHPKKEKNHLDVRRPTSLKGCSVIRKLI